MNNTQTNNRRGTAGSTLIGLGTLVLIASASVKLAHVPQVVEEMARVGFEGEKLTLIAVLEMLSAVLFLMPLTRSFGLLMVSSYLGGAIATHVHHNEPGFGPAIILGLIWLGAWLRHPQILWSFGVNRSSSIADVQGGSRASAKARREGPGRRRT